MNRNIIIALIVIFLIILAGIIVFAQTNVKTDTKINFLSNASLKNGESVEFQLLDSQGKPLTNQNVNISFGHNGKIEHYSITTDQEGKGALRINNEESGNYSVNVNYGGDGKHNPCSASQNIKIGDEPVENGSSSTSSSGNAGNQSSSASTTSDSSSQSSSSLHYDSELNVKYDSNGKVVGGQNDGANYEDIKNNRPQIDEGGNLV